MARCAEAWSGWARTGEAWLGFTEAKMKLIIKTADGKELSGDYSTSEIMFRIRKLQELRESGCKVDWTLK